MVANHRFLPTSSGTNRLIGTLNAAQPKQAIKALKIDHDHVAILKDGQNNFTAVSVRERK